CRNIHCPRHLQLSAARRVRLADDRLPPLLLAAGGPHSAGGTVIAGCHQAAARPRNAARLPDYRPFGVPPGGRAAGIGIPPELLLWREADERRSRSKFRVSAG